MRITVPALTVAAALALTGCATASAPEGAEQAPATSPATTPGPIGPGPYEFVDPASTSTLTATLTATLPADPAAPEVVAFTETLGLLSAPVDELTFLTLDQDNRAGIGKSDPAAIWATDAQGTVYEFHKDEDIIDAYSPMSIWEEDGSDYEWSTFAGDPLDMTAGEALNTAAIEAYNDALNGVPAGARATTVWTYNGTAGPLPDELTSLNVDTHCGTASIGGAQPPTDTTTC